DRSRVRVRNLEPARAGRAGARCAAGARRRRATAAARRRLDRHGEGHDLRHEPPSGHARDDGEIGRAQRRRAARPLDPARRSRLDVQEVTMQNESTHAARPADIVPFWDRLREISLYPAHSAALTTIGVLAVCHLVVSYLPLGSVLDLFVWVAL